MSKVIHANAENFQELIQKDNVLVDFWAEWCSPCKMISPHLDSIAEEQGEKLTVVKVNIDECPQIAAQYNVRGIPTLIRFKKGHFDSQKVGACSRGQLDVFIES